MQPTSPGSPASTVLARLNPTQDQNIIDIQAGLQQK